MQTSLLLYCTVKPGFLSTLFAQRAIFHRIAHDATAPDTVSAIVVCWVDDLLARIGDAVATVAGSSVEDSLPENLQKQRDDDGLRAAAQLPSKSTQLDLLVSNMVTQCIGSLWSMSFPPNRLLLQLNVLPFD